MADYTQTTFFTPKDTLSTGDPNKIILGAEIDPEFTNVATAILTKYDSDDIADTAEAEAGLSDSVLMTPLRVVEWADANAGIVGDLFRLATPAGDGLAGWDNSAAEAVLFAVDNGVEISGTTLQLDNSSTRNVDHASISILAGNGLTGGGTLAATRTITVNAGVGIGVGSDTVVLSHLGLEDLTDPGADRIFFWDNSSGAARWLTAGPNLKLVGTILDLDDTIDNVSIGGSDTTLTRDGPGQLAVEGSAVFTHEDGAFNSAKIHFVTSAPSDGDGANGDIFFVYS